MQKESVIWVLSVVLVAAAAVGYARLRNVPFRFQDKRDREQALENMRREIETLEAHVRDARQRVDKLKSSPVEIEAAIRRVRRFSKDGERIYHIDVPAPQPEAGPQDDPSASVSAQPAQPQAEE